MKPVEPNAIAPLVLGGVSRSSAEERGLRGLRWALRLAVLCGIAGWFAPASAQASGVRGKKAVPNLRNPTSPARAGRHATVRIPVTLHLATRSGEAVTSARNVERWVARTNALLAPHGIEVDVVRVLRLPSGYRAITRRQERRELARFAAHDGTVHLFVTEALDLEYRPALRRRIRGLHWRYWGLRRDLKRREYVVVTRDAPDTTLAHEIGHLLGLRHSFASDNVMCSCRESPAGFTADQGRAMRGGAVNLRARQSRTAADRR